MHLKQTLMLLYIVLHRSYYPFWEGKVCIESIPVYNLSPINLTETGSVVKVTGWAFVAGDKPMRVSLQIHLIIPFFLSEVKFMALSFRSIWLNVIKTNYIVHEHKDSPCINKMKLWCYCSVWDIIHRSHRVNLVSAEKNKVKLISILTFIPIADHTLSSKWLQGCIERQIQTLILH